MLGLLLSESDPTGYETQVASKGLRAYTTRLRPGKSQVSKTSSLDQQGGDCLHFVVDVCFSITKSFANVDEPFLDFGWGPLARDRVSNCNSIREEESRDIPQEPVYTEPYTTLPCPLPS